MTEAEELAEHIRKTLLYDEIRPQRPMTVNQARFYVRLMLGDESHTVIENTAYALHKALQ
jgi:hypothetical protein